MSFKDHMPALVEEVINEKEKSNANGGSDQSSLASDADPDQIDVIREEVNDEMLSSVAKQPVFDLMSNGADSGNGPSSSEATPPAQMDSLDGFCDVQLRNPKIGVDNRGKKT